MHVVLHATVLVAIFVCGANTEGDSNKVGVGQRDLVVVVDFSANMQGALQNLINGAVKFFEAYSGHSSKYNLVAYSYTSSGPLTKLVDTADPSEFLNSMAKLRDTEPEGCEIGCCCSTAMERHLPGIIYNHLGGVILLTLDCLTVISTPELPWNISQTIRQHGTELYTIKLATSYCLGMGDDLKDIYITEKHFLVDGENIGRAFEAVMLHVNSLMTGEVYSAVCKNVTMSTNIRPSSQALGYIIYRSRLSTPVLWRNPDKTPYRGNIHTALNDSNGALIQFLYPDCPKSWVFSSGRCWLRSSRKMSWDAAEDFCKANNASLVTQIDATDEDFLKNSDYWNQEAIGIDGDQYWIGLQDHNFAKVFGWSLPKSFVYLNITAYQRWAPGEPLGLSPGSRCVGLSRRQGVWSVRYCRSLLQPLCKRASYGFEFGAPKQFLTPGYYYATLDSYDTCYARGYNLY